MASTQTKIDVQDEDIKAIQGNLAYRFKAAKSIYAKVEDLSVEPLSRDERLVCCCFYVKASNGRQFRRELPVAASSLNW